MKKPITAALALIGLAVTAALVLAAIVPLVQGTGTGPNFADPLGIAVEASGDLVVVDFGIDAVVRVDPVTGDRAIVSDAGTGAGPNLMVPLDIAGAKHPGAYVKFGGPALPAVLDLSVAAADVVVLGQKTSDQAGRSVAGGDVDGDTIGDIVVGAPFADPPGASNAGELYVVYGSVSLPAQIDLGGRNR